MIQVSDWFKTWMEKQTLNLLRKFTYDNIHETERIEAFGSINRASDSIVSGGTSLALINADKHWNKFLSDKSNLRREAKIQLAIGVPNTPARSGIARSGATLSNLLSYTQIAGNEEWLDILTGWGDDPEFPEATVFLPIRDKFARLLEKELGSDEVPLNYYSSAYNPADLTWDILTTHGGLDATASTANTDIDYITWSTWKTACATANLSLKARFTGQSIREALERIRDLTNSDIYQAGNGIIKFFRFTQGAPPAESCLFNTDKFKDFSVKPDSSKILNHLTVHYGYTIPPELVTNGTMEAVDSWSNKGSPPTNARSSEQIRNGSYSRKISTDEIYQGAYQDIPTVVGKTYKVSAWFYVSQGDAILGLGSVAEHYGFAGKGATEYSSGDDRLVLCHGSNIYPPRDGTLHSIVLYIKANGYSSKVKCALYQWTGAQFELVTNGTTEEHTIPSDFEGWKEFVFSTPPSVLSSNYYYLTYWNDSAGMKRYQETGVGWYDYYNSVYNSWPDPFGPSSGHESDKISIFAKYELNSDVILSSPTSEGAWVQRTITFTATNTTTRIFFEAASIHNSIFYVDDVSVKEDYSPFWTASYLKEDAASQQPPPNGFGLCSEVVDGTVVWHATLASATSYADRRIQIFKGPLEVITFTSFMMGMITEIGDIIRVTNAFFSYTNKYFRVHKITALNLANATISFEAADFKDITP